jgi:nucleoside-diphosphate-sugar epimerase
MISNKILLTGGAGYIGSSIADYLTGKGFNITVIDKLEYKNFPFNHLLKYKNFKFIYGNILNKKFFNKKLIKKFDIIIPLAALVGAPLCERKKNLATLTNLKSIEYLTKNMEKKQKIIFATSNSGYGIGEKGKFCDENSPLRPVSHYGVTKMKAEKEVVNFKNSVSFRLATVFGYSFRMRSDLLVNNFVELSVKNKKIQLFESNFRRNFIHIQDVCRAFEFAINNFTKMKGQIYNLGLSSANLTKNQLALRIKKKLPKLKISYIKNKSDPDKRDYFVSNKKIEKLGFKPIFTLDSGISELIEYFKLNNKKIINNY